MAYLFTDPDDNQRSKSCIYRMPYRYRAEKRMSVKSEPLEGCKVRDDRSIGLRHISGYMTDDSSGYSGNSAVFIDFAGSM